MIFDIVDYQKSAGKCDFSARILVHSEFLLYLCNVKGNEQQKLTNMEATISYNPRNRVARATMEYIQSLGVFTVTPICHPKTSQKKKEVNAGVDQQLWSDLMGALKEVKNHHEGMKQMKDAYELLNEL